MRFQDWLSSNTVNDVLLSKTVKSDEFISISIDGTIWDAMWILGSNDISAISVYAMDPNVADRRIYQHILTISDFLSFMQSYLNEGFPEICQDVDALKEGCLSLPVSKIIQSHGHDSEHLRPTFVHREASLLELINIWVEKQAYASSHKVLVGCENNVHDVLTMTDFIHYCFVNAHQLPDVMQAHALPALFPGTKTPSPFSASSLVEDSESTWSALKKLLDSSPIQVVGVTNSCNGNLIGYLSSMDFMPACSSDQIFSIVGNLHRSVASFIRMVTKSPLRLIDAVTFRDHMTLEQLIERLLKLRVHMLWRIAFTGQIIGVVTVIDVLRYFKRCSEDS